MNVAGAPPLPGRHLELVERRIPAGEGLGHDLVARQHHSENFAKLTTAYQYLSRAMGIPIADPAAH